jgi:predicted ATPase/DNA-binding CsgD family transcriptional regulator
MQVTADPDPTAGELPQRLSSFVGRRRERSEVAGALAATRLLTLTGVGGCGKTSLGLEVARDVADQFGDGAFWIELAPLGDSAMLATAVARGVGCRPLPNESELDGAIRFLAPRRALLVLDNCEHLVESCAQIARLMLLGCPEVKVMATSRVPLGVEGEADWRVPSMSLPADDTPDAVLDSDAGRLFDERARLVQPAFSIEATSPAHVVDICRRLDGIPLAIELAAARLRIFSVQQIAGALNDALSVIGGGARSALPRHRTLRASIQWSHELLEGPERMLFRRLGVFAGGFTFETAEQVCTDQGLNPSGLLDALSSLVEKSLVQAEQGPFMRYRLLETIRQYALERLAEAGESDAVRGRHRDTFLALAERLAGEAFGPRQPRVMTAFDSEAANLSAALAHAVATDGDAALRLTVAIAPWWRARARYHEAEGAYERALAGSGGTLPVLRTGALSARAWVIANSGRHLQAQAYGNQAVEEARATGVPSALLRALLALGNAQIFTDPRGAELTLGEAHRIAREEDDAWAVGRSEMLMGAAASFRHDPGLHHRWTDGLPSRLERLGDLETLAAHWLFAAYLAYPAADVDAVEEATERNLAASSQIDEPNLQFGAMAVVRMTEFATGRAEPALAGLRELEAQTLERGLGLLPWLIVALANAEAACGDLESSAARLEAFVAHEKGALEASLSGLAALSEVLRLRSDERAQQHALRALRLAEAIGNRWHEARSRLVLGRLAAARDEVLDAEKQHHLALDAIVEQGHRLELPSALEALAEAAAGLGRFPDAARTLGASSRIRHDLGLVAWPAQSDEVARLAARLRDALGAEAFDQMTSEGSELAESDAIAWIRRGRGKRKRPTRGWAGLTPTELTVTHHVAAGLTNPEIASRMFVSRTTIKTHLAHIYAKLAIANRAQLAVEAHRHLRAGE